MTFQTKIADPALRMRAAWAEAVCFALAHSHPIDGAAICAAYLETAETGGPLLGDPFGLVVGDARLWAASAPPHELAAYTLAGLERLPKSQLSTGTRKTAFMAIWRSFNDHDRAAFLCAVRGANYGRE
ncbi:hypothetical protein [Tabrizicola sp. BL-A-41-H6]|uniref:hypothetical protein n=1 Tax=Tabrizicola sp. BL-A-41-H6 TaxID=3421107 RepID=UPI003D676224